MNAADRVEDALFLLDNGAHPTEIAKRLGTTVQALDQLLRRHGHTRKEFMTEAQRKCKEVTVTDPTTRLIDRGRAAGGKARTAAERAAKAIAALTAALDEHDANTELRAEVERLEEQLAAAKAKLRGRKPAAHAEGHCRNGHDLSVEGRYRCGSCVACKRERNAAAAQTRKEAAA